MILKKKLKSTAVVLRIRIVTWKFTIKIVQKWLLGENFLERSGKNEKEENLRLNGVNCLKIAPCLGINSLVLLLCTLIEIPNIYPCCSVYICADFTVVEQQQNPAPGSNDQPPTYNRCLLFTMCMGLVKPRPMVIVCVLRTAGSYIIWNYAGPLSSLRGCVEVN